MKLGVGRGIARNLRSGAGAAAIVLAAVSPGVSAANDDLRVALVIGNARYETAPLVNPANDARDVAQALRNMGFQVLEARDATKVQMEQALASARETLKGRRGVGLLYYAGHGMQLDWRNYLLPVDARLRDADDVRRDALDVQQVLDSFRDAGTRMNIVVLDACRDNPFGSAASGKGLAQMDAPPGTLLAYATAPGNVAEDGDARSSNGLYTTHLLREIARADARIEDVFKRVRFEVRRASQGRQIPWESTSLEDDFSFGKGIQPVQRESAQEREQTFKLQLNEWSAIKDSSNVDDFFGFLKRFPNGLMAEQALTRVERLARSRVELAPVRNPASVRRIVDPKYRLGDRFVFDVHDAYGVQIPPRDLRVTEVSRGRVILNDGQEIWDESGNLVKDACCSREPAKGLLPSEIAVGKKWRSAYRALAGPASNPLFWDFQVAALEDVRVPAGVFRAYRIEGSGWTSTGSHQTETYWIDADSFVIIKDIFMRRKESRVDGGYRRELREMHRAPPATSSGEAKP